MTDLDMLKDRWETRQKELLDEIACVDKKFEGCDKKTIEAEKVKIYSMIAALNHAYYAELNERRAKVKQQNEAKKSIKKSWKEIKEIINNL